jgi:hypothetical protein
VIHPQRVSSIRRFRLVVASALLVVACDSDKPKRGSITLMPGSGSASGSAPSPSPSLVEVADAAPAAPADAGAAVTADGRFTKLVISGKTSCVLLADASVRCWGENDSGQLGTGTTADASKPVAPKNLGAVKDLAVTPSSVCALRTDGTVACSGKLADGAGPKLLLPTPLAGITGATRFVGDSCVAVADDNVMCWRGAPFVKKPGTPVAVPELAKATVITDGFVLYADGTTKYVDRASKQLVASKLTGVAEIQSHGVDDVYCGRLADGAIRCFGNSLACKLGVADPIMSPSKDGKSQTPFTEEPVTLQLPAARELALDAGENLCAVTNESQLSCIDVGDSALKRCGKVTSLLDSVRTVNNTCALLNDGSVNCWIFDPSRRRNLVAAIAGVANATQLAVGHSHGCAITAAGVFCWGNNDSGQLGRGAADKASHPEALPVVFQ